MKKKILLLIFSLFMLFSIGANAEDIYTNRNAKIESLNLEIAELKERIAELEEQKEKISTIDTLDFSGTEANRPKIGVALSGGGAKGVAHIGVLKEIEKHNVPIDYISGTSMGSIVAAMYAAGYGIDEMQEILLAVDWEILFTDVKLRTEETLEAKKDLSKYFVRLHLNKYNQVTTPKGVIRGEAIYLLFSELFWRVQHIKDFDDLPVPYRAVATNLETGEPEAIDSGDLALAVFKSMAIPTIIDPIYDKNTLYVDGGVVKNLPVDEVIDMGADIVIASDVGLGATVDENSNIGDVLNKISTYEGARSVKEQLQLADIVITPSVDSHSPAAFTSLEELILEGEVAARQQSKALKQISYKGKEPINVRKQYPLSEPVEINEVFLTNTKTLTEEEVEFLRPVPDGELLTKYDISQWMARIYQLKSIDRVFYEVIDETLVIDVSEEHRAQLAFGANYDRDVEATLGLYVDLPNYNNVNQGVEAALEVSSTPGAWVGIYDKRYWKQLEFNTKGRIGWREDPLHFYRGDDKLSEYENTELYMKGSTGFTYKEKMGLEFDLSLRNVTDDYDEGIRQPSEIDYNGTFVEPQARIFYDTKDDHFYATKGIDAEARVSTAVHTGGDSVNFNAFTYSVEGFVPLTKKLTFKWGTSGGKISGDDVPISEYFKIGGLRDNLDRKYYSFYGLETMRKFSDEFYTASVGFNYQFAPSLYLVSRYNILTYETDIDFSSPGRNLFDNYTYGFGAGLGWNSFIGPVEFIVAPDADTSGYLYSLYIGYKF